MKPLRIIAVLLLSIPMTLGLGVAYIFGVLIRWINKADEPQPEPEPNVVPLHQKPEDRLWPLD